MPKNDFIAIVKSISNLLINRAGLGVLFFIYVSGILTWAMAYIHFDLPTLGGSNIIVAVIGGIIIGYLQMRFSKKRNYNQKKSSYHWNP